MHALPVRGSCEQRASCSRAILLDHGGGQPSSSGWSPPLQHTNARDRKRVGRESRFSALCEEDSWSECKENPRNTHRCGRVRKTHAVSPYIPMKGRDSLELRSIPTAERVITHCRSAAEYHRKRALPRCFVTTSGPAKAMS